MNEALYSVGIDIGTTTVSAVVLDVNSGETVQVLTKEHNADISSEYEWDKRQDVEILKKCVTEMLDSIIDRFDNIRSIGFTGQMHGILYVDAKGHPLSDLYTWQDGRAGIPDTDGKTVCEKLNKITGYRIAPGYGFATHLFLQMNGDVPEGADTICTVMDYIASSLCSAVPVMHISNAASLGFFNVAESEFDNNALRLVGVKDYFVPDYVDCGYILGRYRNIPVVCAIGDNQASVYGSVGEMNDCVIVNYGTGSQVSVLTDMYTEENESAKTEIRPFLFDEAYLVSGSALCGGRAYSILERFFREYTSECGYSENEQYEFMNRLAIKGINRIENDPEIKLLVNTEFCGTRIDPSCRGSIMNIGENNFTPDLLIAGLIYGMVNELHDMYLTMPYDTVNTLVISGNAARKNEALQKVIKNVFGMSPLIPIHTEEAAFGAALFAAKTTHPDDSETLINNCIKYKSV